jgi:hypothetical protein
MSTPKNLITNTFLSLIDDRNLCIDLTDQEMTGILDYYLKDSTYLRFKSCLKDLSDNEPFDFHTDTFVADGVNKTYILSKYPNSPNPDAIRLSAKVNSVNVEYNFDEETLTFDLVNLPDEDDEVIIGYDFFGQFQANLNEEEILILSYGMLLSWFSRILYKHENFRNRITPKDYNTFSSANLLDKLLQIKKDAEKQIRNLIISYSFNGFTGFN